MEQETHSPLSLQESNDERGAKFSESLFLVLVS